MAYGCFCRIKPLPRPTRGGGELALIRTSRGYRHLDPPYADPHQRPDLKQLELYCAAGGGKRWPTTPGKVGTAGLEDPAAPSRHMWRFQGHRPDHA